MLLCGIWSRSRITSGGSGFFHRSPHQPATFFHLPDQKMMITCPALFTATAVPKCNFYKLPSSCIPACSGFKRLVIIAPDNGAMSALCLQFAIRLNFFMAQWKTFMWWEKSVARKMKLTSMRRLIFRAGERWLCKFMTKKYCEIRFMCRATRETFWA